MKETLGFAMCGSFCTHRAALAVMEQLTKQYEIVPILSYNAAQTDTRFGGAAELTERIRQISGRDPVVTLTEAETFGPSRPLDAMLICPCTGNTLSRLAGGMADTPVSLAAKAHLRSDRNLLIALASNDAMTGNFLNLGRLLQRKHVYFVPMKQDDPVKKPHSLVADFSLCWECLEEMKRGIQHRPLFTV